MQSAEAYLRGLSDLEAPRGTIRLWRNLRGVAATRLEDTDFNTLTAIHNGEPYAGFLKYQELPHAKFPEGVLRQLP